MSLGVAEAGASRYAYVWVLLLLPSTVAALTQLVRRWSASRWVGVWLAPALTLNGVAELTTYADASSPGRATLGTSPRRARSRSAAMGPPICTSPLRAARP